MLGRLSGAGVFLTPELYAAATAVCFAGANIFSKRGLQHTGVVSGLIVTLTTSCIVTGCALLLDPPDAVTTRGIALLAGGGLVAPGIARWASIWGLKRLGPSVSVPIQHGAHPLLAVLGATAFLGEHVGLPRVLGVAAIVLGGMQLSRRPVALRGVKDRPPGVRGYLRPGIVYPLIAGASYAISNMLLKEGLNDIPFPTFASTIATGVALLFWLAIGLRSEPVRQGLRVGKGLRWFAFAGILVGFAFLSLNRALEDGDVSLVSPIIASQPLAVFLLSHFFLKGIERLTLGTVLAGSLVVAGAILVAA